MSKIKNWAIENIESDSDVDLEFREMQYNIIKEACDVVGSLTEKQIRDHFYAYAAYKYGNVTICGLVTEKAITVLYKVDNEAYEDLFNEWKQENLFFFEEEYYDKESVDMMVQDLYKEPLDFTGATEGDR